MGPVRCRTIPPPTRPDGASGGSMGPGWRSRAADEAAARPGRHTQHERTEDDHGDRIRMSRAPAMTQPSLRLRASVERYPASMRLTVLGGSGGFPAGRRCLQRLPDRARRVPPARRPGVRDRPAAPRDRAGRGDRRRARQPRSPGPRRRPEPVAPRSRAARRSGAATAGLRPSGRPEAGARRSIRSRP